LALVLLAHGCLSTGDLQGAAATMKRARVRVEAGAEPEDDLLIEPVALPKPPEPPPPPLLQAEGADEVMPSSSPALPPEETDPEEEDQEEDQEDQARINLMMSDDEQALGCSEEEGGGSSEEEGGGSSEEEGCGSSGVTAIGGGGRFPGFTGHTLLGSVTERERMYTAAWSNWVRGDVSGALRDLRAILERFPKDLFVIKV